MRRSQIAILLGLTLAASSARAEDTARTGAATQLFDEGLAAMNKGNLDEACPKLQKSQDLAPNGGTLLALGECYEKTGKFASAWVAYKSAVDRAITARKADAEKMARERAARVEAKVSRVTVEVPKPSEVDGLVIKRDGKAVTSAEWNTPLPLDPGVHTFEATAPAHRPWSSRVTVGDTASQKTLTVPPLEALPSEQAATPPPTPSPPVTEPPPEETGNPGKGQRIAGLVVGGVGIVGLGVGTYFGLSAKSKNDDAASHCVTDTRCDATGMSLDKDARDAATISTIAFIAGGALTVGGLVLYLTAPSKKEPSASVGFRGAPGGGAVTFGGWF